jgi:RNA polymerase sigma-70 factor, ECF subfamily
VYDAWTVSDGLSGRDLEVRAACEAGRWSEAATTVLGVHGDEILGYLVAMTRDQDLAGDAFSIFGEMMWKALPRFRFECSTRTWAYQIARHALGRVRRDPHRRRARPLEDAAVAAMVAQVRTRTATFLRSETRDKVAAIRAGLPPDDRALLILRINRNLPWRDIARALSDDEDADAAALDRSAAALRKRFERLKAELRERVRVGS